MSAVLKRLRSKTYWLGFATLALGVLEAAQATGHLPELFGEASRAWAMVGVSVAIFVLREFTHKPVSDK